jgi:hypothetical protein
MPLLSVIGVGTDALYTIDDDLQNLQQVTLDDPPAGIKKFSYSDNGFVVTVQGSPGVAALYDNMSTKVSQYVFETVHAPAVCISSSGEWYFIASSEGRIELYCLKRGMPPTVLATLSPGYSALTYNCVSGYLVCLSTTRAEAVEICPKTGTRLSLKNAHKLKYGTGAVSDGRGRITYYTTDNTLKRCVITSDGVIETLDETPLWEEVGADEYVPAADPAVNSAGELFCLGASGGSVLKFSEKLSPAAYTAVAGVSALSYPEFMYIPDGLILPGSIDCGTIQIPFCAVPVEFSVSASTVVRSLHFTAPASGWLSLDGVGWQRELYIGTLAAGASITVKLHINTIDPGRVQKALTVNTSVTAGSRTVPVSWTGKVPDKLVFPVKAFENVPKTVNDVVTVKRIRPSLIIKSVPLTVNFEE